MPEEISKQLDNTSEEKLEKYRDEFKKYGGHLDIYSYWVAREILGMDLEGKSLTKKNRPSRIKVENMAHRAGVELSENEKEAYIRLRDETPPKELPQGDVGEKGWKRPTTLSDKELLLEVLRAAGRSDAVEKVLEAYPTLEQGN